jgi:copper chaperone CopZ
MHCDACVRRVTATLSGLPGVRVQSVKVGEASLHYDTSQVTTETITAALRDGGFDIEGLT